KRATVSAADGVGLDRCIADRGVVRRLEACTTVRRATNVDGTTARIAGHIDLRVVRYIYLCARNGDGAASLAVARSRSIDRASRIDCGATRIEHDFAVYDLRAGRLNHTGVVDYRIRNVCRCTRGHQYAA